MSHSILTNCVLQIFEDAGIGSTGTALIASGAYGIVKLVFTMVFTWGLVDYFGRRPSFIAGLSLQLVGHLYLLFFNAFASKTSDATTSIAILAVFVYAVGWSIGESRSTRRCTLAPPFFTLADYGDRTLHGSVSLWYRNFPNKDQGCLLRFQYGTTLVLSVRCCTSHSNDDDGSAHLGWIPVLRIRVHSRVGPTVLDGARNVRLHSMFSSFSDSLLTLH